MEGPLGFNDADAREGWTEPCRGLARTMRLCTLTPAFHLCPATSGQVHTPKTSFLDEASRRKRASGDSCLDGVLVGLHAGHLGGCGRPHLGGGARLHLQGGQGEGGGGEGEIVGDSGESKLRHRSARGNE